MGGKFRVNVNDLKVLTLWRILSFVDDKIYCRLFRRCVCKREREDIRLMAVPRGDFDSCHSVINCNKSRLFFPGGFKYPYELYMWLIFFVLANVKFWNKIATRRQESKTGTKVFGGIIFIAFDSPIR